MKLTNGKIFDIILNIVLCAIVGIIFWPHPVKALHVTTTLSQTSGTITPPGSIQVTVNTTWSAPGKPAILSAGALLLSLDVKFDPEEVTPENPTSVMTISGRLYPKPGIYKIGVQACPPPDLVGRAQLPAPHPCAVNPFQLTVAETPIRIKGFVGLSREMPLSQAQVNLLYDNQVLESRADDDGNYSFEVTPKPGQTLKGQIQVILSDDKWIEVYDVLGPDKSTFLVEYTSAPFKIDPGSAEITKVFLINDKLESNVHEKKFNRDVAAVYHWSWKAAKFAEQILNLPPELVGIFTFKKSPGAAGSYSAGQIGRINISNGGVKQAGEAKPELGIYPAILWHEFSHHIEAIAPFFGKPGEFDRIGYINHGGYRNKDSKDSVQEGFAEFLASVMADHYGFRNPHVIVPPDGWANLENNFPIWLTFGQNQGQEDAAVASILWDLYDGENPLDADRLQVPLAELWQVLNTRLTKPSTIYDIFLAFDSHLEQKTQELVERARASDAYVDALPRNGQFDDAERGSRGRSNWGYNDDNKNGKRDPDEQFGTDPKYPRFWDFERRSPPPIINSVVILDVRDKRTKKPIKSFVAKVKISHPKPYDFYDWDYQYPATSSPAKIPIPVLIRPDALAKVEVKADGYKEMTVYEIDGKSYLKKMLTPKLKFLKKVLVNLVPLAPTKLK